MKNLSQRILLFNLIVLMYTGAIAQTPQCPTLTLTGPAGILVPYEKDEFLIKTTADQNLTGVTVVWNASSGAITPQKDPTRAFYQPTNKEAGTSVRISANISSESSQCKSFLSGDFAVLLKSFDPLLDQFGKVSANDFRARLDNLMYSVERNPGSVGVLMIYFEKGTARSYKLEQLKFIFSHFKFRKYPMDQLLIKIVENAQIKEEHRIYILPSSMMTTKIDTETESFLLSELPQKLNALFSEKN